MKLVVTLIVAMIVVFVGGVLAAADAIELPGDWGKTLGLRDDFEYPPCHRGLYRHTVDTPRASAGRWRFEPPAPRAPVEGSAVAIGPVIYATNGERPGNLRTVLAYDTRTRRWSRPTSSPVGLNHVQAATYRGNLYLAGGYLEGDEATNKFWEYDPSNNRWTQLPPMGLARGGAAAAVIGRKLYVAGGAPQTFGVELSGLPYGTLEIYDFATGTWERGPDLPLPRHHTVGVSLRGKFYVAGGRPGLRDIGITRHPVADFDRFNPQIDEWEELADVPVKVSFEGITTARGEVVIVGGEDPTGWEDGGGFTSATAWAYDPRADRWHRLPNLGIERRGFGAATVGGRIYALMGSYCQGLTPDGPQGTRTMESLPVSAVRDQP